MYVWSAIYQWWLKVYTSGGEFKRPRKVLLLSLTSKCLLEDSWQEAAETVHTDLTSHLHTPSSYARIISLIVMK